ncbi:hypothetical protein H2199_007089 [Coniosporium tulheliwenetii]|uniref:Uncharacterized protein n=1 Tax=Coniosporium tulheliwenetii TaxID=3383036 RepID=A0ACC2YSY5_9PEZI|nr:hypothetical protein H2199_007089 [Cladosporium sp. JES 115]
MDKLKNILSPGHRKDDEALYGSEQSSNDPSRNTGSETGSGIGGTTAGEPELVKEYKAMALDHSHGGIGHQYRGERMQPPEPAPHFTRGPHVTDTANRLDPRIAATPIIGEPQPLSNVATEIIGARSTATDEQGYGRDSGLAGASTTGTSTGYGSTHSSDLANRADPRVDSDRDGSRGMGSTSTGAGYGSTTSGPHSSDLDHDGSRLAGGATTGAGYGSTTGLINKAKEMLTGGGKSHDDTTSSSYDSTSRSTIGHDTSGPHSSSLANRADPRVDSDRDGSRVVGTGTTSTGYDSSTTGGIGLQHRGDDRDSALADANVRARAAIAENLSHSGSRAEPTAQTSTPRITEPHRSEMMNRMDPRIDSTPSTTGQSDRHTGRDAALAGGAGAAGAAAYGTSRDRPHHEHGSPMTGSYGRNPYSSTAIDPRVDATPRASQATTSHHGRDAALAGGAGAAGLGAGAYAASRGSEPSPRSSYDNQRTAGQAGYNTYQDPRTSQNAEAERIKAEQAHQRELAKEQRQREKEVAKLEKEEEKHEKEAKKAAHKHDDGKDSTDKEKHHGLLGLFRRNKDEDQTTAADPAAQRYQREVAGDPTTNVKSVADPHVHEHDRNLPSSGAAMPQYQREDFGDPTTNVKSVADPPHLHDHDRNRLHKDPPPGYAGGATDTDTARASSTVPLRQHVGTDEPIGDSSRVSGERGTAAGTDDGIVIEPITGLPMNVGKYGSGYGGTDGNPVIEGYYGDSRGPSVDSGAPTGSSTLTGRTGADYDNIRKGTNPYEAS